MVKLFEPPAIPAAEVHPSRRHYLSCQQHCLFHFQELVAELFTVSFQSLLYVSFASTMASDRSSRRCRSFRCAFLGGSTCRTGNRCMPIIKKTRPASGCLHHSPVSNCIPTATERCYHKDTQMNDRRQLLSSRRDM